MFSTPRTTINFLFKPCCFCDKIIDMRNKISFLAMFAIALNVNYVCASECIGEDCKISPVEKIETADILVPVEYEINWTSEQTCEYDYNCPFDTKEACAVWYKKPAFKTTVAPRAPHLNPVRVEDIIFAIHSYNKVSSETPEMSPLIQRYEMLMNAGDACCTAGIISKMRENGASDKAIYKFLKDDANRFAVTKRCLVMGQNDITSNYSNGVTGEMVADVRNLCLCKNHDWFDSMLQPFVDIYKSVPSFGEEPFVYSYTDGMGREINVSMNEDVQKALEILSACPE
jgi:hypothetical protein